MQNTLLYTPKDSVNSVYQIVFQRLIKHQAWFKLSQNKTIANRFIFYISLY